MTIWIALELPLFNFGRLDILYAWIGPLSEKLWPFEFLESFPCSISSVSIFYVPESDLRVKSYDHLNISRASIIQFRASLYVMRLNRTSEWNVRPFEFLKSFRSSILSVSIYYTHESDLRGKSNDHLNFSIVFVFSFSSIAIYRGPHAYTQVQSYGRLSLPRASMFNF